MRTQEIKECFMPDYRTVTAHGCAIPSIGLGTWTLKDQACAEIVSSALGAGYRHLDTARMYDNEAAVGEGLRASKVARKDVFITTKVWSDDIGDGDLQRSAEASLKRLGLDQVDLLLIHWPNANIPLKDSIKALCETKTRGLTKHIGVSNFPVAMLNEAVALSSEPIVANQCEYHPHLDTTKVIAACRKHDVAFVSYCPLGRGSLGGVIGEPLVKDIAARVNRTPAQVTLRWHVQQGLVAIPRSSNKQRVAENLAVYDFELTPADVAGLAKLARPDGRVVKPATAPKWD
jgi:diketogulonate reductase-like aldo/keto reductase